MRGVHRFKHVIDQLCNGWVEAMNFFSFLSKNRIFCSDYFVNCHNLSIPCTLAGQRITFVGALPHDPQAGDRLIFVYNCLYRIISGCNMLETFVTTYIDKHQLLSSRGEIVAGVSGGADSLCLLHLLHQLCGPGKHYSGVRLHAAHLNHKLRGEVGDRDAAAVASIVESWGLPLTLGASDVPALARTERRSLEDAARTARYRFLRQLAHGQPIAVAHPAADLVDTLLLHWLRGSGLAGYGGFLSPVLKILTPPFRHVHVQSGCVLL